jgi:hypothetical protein
MNCERRGRGEDVLHMGGGGAGVTGQRGCYWTEIRATPFVCPMFRRTPEGVVYSLVVMPPASLSGFTIM